MTNSLVANVLALAHAAEIAARYDEAAHHAETALVQAQQQQETSTSAQAQKLLGDIAAHQGQPQRAREAYAAALNICRGEDTLPVEVYTHVALAELEGRFGETRQASTHLERALQLVGAVADESLRAWVDAGHAGLWRKWRMVTFSRYGKR
jgi:tetratricopeptide (TPR) repeat protein